MKTAEELKQARHEYYITHRDIWLKNAIENKEANNAHKRLYAQKNPEKVVKVKVEYAMRTLTAKQEYARQYDKLHMTEKVAYAKARYELARTTFLEMYGNKCECCGETERMFLAIDHIKGQKGKSRKETGTPAYKKANASYDPTTYRILCHNCNFATRFEGAVCPHQILEDVQSIT